MEERKLIQSDTQCQANAVEISNAVFAWDDAQNSNNNAVNSDEITCNFDDVESESKHGSQYSKLNQIEGREETSVCQTKYGFESSHSAVQFKSGKVRCSFANSTLHPNQASARGFHALASWRRPAARHPHES